MCDYCNGSPRLLIEREIVLVYVRGEVLRAREFPFEGNVSEVVETPINYCPMCGRKLREGE